MRAHWLAIRIDIGERFSRCNREHARLSDIAAMDATGPPAPFPSRLAHAGSGFSLNDKEETEKCPARNLLSALSFHSFRARDGSGAAFCAFGSTFGHLGAIVALMTKAHEVSAFEANHSDGGWGR